MILHPIRHLELSTYKGTKKARETSDMAMGLPTESTKNTKIRIPMKLDDKSQQITQITQKIESVKSVKFVDEDIKQQNTQKNAKKDSCPSCHPLAKIIHCASHLVHPVRLVTKKKRFVLLVSSVGKKKEIRC